MKTHHKLGLAGIVAIGALAVMGTSLGTKRVVSRAVDLAQIKTAQVELTTQPVSGLNTGGHVGANGVREVILSGDAAHKGTAAALEAVEGGTILRLETDAEGSPYEAHMKRADGSLVTVKFDSNFKVTKIEEGKGKL